MSRSPSRHPELLVPVLSALAATVLFAWASQLDSFLRGFCLGAGLALVGVTAVMVARLRQGAPGWRPSRDSAATAPERGDDPR